VGLPAGFALEGSWMPPLEVDGAQPQLFGLALSRDLLERSPWRLAGRLALQTGDIDGDFTCPAAAARAGDDPVANPYGCTAASSDEMSLDSAGLEVALARRLGDTAGLEAWLAATLRWLDASFQVDAEYAGVRDHTRLDYDGVEWGLAAGLGGTSASRLWRWGAEIAWTPLDIARPPDYQAESEPLLHGRILVARRLR
jgi:hypothetical protein